MSGRDTFHRYEDDYLTASEWGAALNIPARVAEALGSEPIEDARHLLAPIALPPPAPPLPPGPHPATAFVVDVLPQAAGNTLTSEAVHHLFALETRAHLDFPQVWAERPGRGDTRIWTPLDDIPAQTRLLGLALAWPLTDLLSEGAEAANDLRRYMEEAGRLAATLGMRAQAREGASEAAQRAARLLTLKRRLGRNVEMRLLPQGRPFPSRAIWRALYSLGLTWGDLDLFHWRNTATGTALFTVSAVGLPGYFLPERAAEGERIGGIALSFELPFSPAPLAVYDRMAVALAYLRQRLGGHPVAQDGAELDADRLYADRDVLEEAINEMTRAGIAPGSPEAARFF